MAETVIVTRIDSDFNYITKTELSQLWLNQTTHINNIKIDFRDLPEDHPARLSFYKHIVGKTGKSLSAYWAKRVFRGKGFPPNILDSESELTKWLIADKNRVGYLDSRYIDNDKRSVLFLIDTVGDD